MSEWFSAVVTIIEWHLDCCADRVSALQALSDDPTDVCFVLMFDGVSQLWLVDASGGSWHRSRLADWSSWDSDPPSSAEYSTHSSETLVCTLSSGVKQLRQVYSPKEIILTQMSIRVFFGRLWSTIGNPSVTF